MTLTSPLQKLLGWLNSNWAAFAFSQSFPQETSSSILYDGGGSTGFEVQILWFAMFAVYNFSRERKSGFAACTNIGWESITMKLSSFGVAMSSQRWLSMVLDQASTLGSASDETSTTGRTWDGLDVPLLDASTESPHVGLYAVARPNMYCRIGSVSEHRVVIGRWCNRDLYPAYRLVHVSGEQLCGIPDRGFQTRVIGKCRRCLHDGLR